MKTEAEKGKPRKSVKKRTMEIPSDRTMEKNNGNSKFFHRLLSGFLGLSSMACTVKPDALCSECLIWIPDSTTPSQKNVFCYFVGKCLGGFLEGKLLNKQFFKSDRFKNIKAHFF